MKQTSILVIDDDQSILDVTEFYLRSHGYEVSSALAGSDGVKLAESRQFDLAITDLMLPDIDGIQVVRELKSLSPTTEIIVISGNGSVAQAVEATKAGAFYFVEKPLNFDELAALLDKALERRRQREEIKQLRGKLVNRTSYYDIIGGSKVMQDIYEIVDSVAISDANVLIVGESGTGKELIANALHYKSAHSKKPFVKINCSALPKELIESELFGHTKGAFTGASMEKAGLFERAEGGSLLLDEIAEMPVELQPKLLRVLQERVYYRLGGEKALDADFRLISATNRDPRTAIAEGRLREDLYYRINTIEINVPPLSARMEDLQHLAEHFLKTFAEKYDRQVHGISDRSYQYLFDYSWPGNVRELQNVIERAVLLSKGDLLEIDPGALRQHPSSKAAIPAGSAAAALDRWASKAESDPENLPLEELGRIVVDHLPDPKTREASVDLFDELERVLVIAALGRTKGNKQAAANILGIYRPRLYSLIKRHHLAPNGVPSPAPEAPEADTKYSERAGSA